MLNCKYGSEICQKAARQINPLKRLSKFLTLESRMSIFRSFIMSNFNYCSLVWHACGVKNTRKLEKLQERALRFVYLDKVSSYDDLVTKANLTTLHLGRLTMLATEVYKSVHKLNPQYIQDIYKLKPRYRIDGYGDKTIFTYPESIQQPMDSTL